jgi:hypothetical protein
MIRQAPALLTALMIACLVAILFGLEQDSFRAASRSAYQTSGVSAQSIGPASPEIKETPTGNSSVGVPSKQIEIAGQFYPAFTPLVIACGALLAMVSLRNSDLASRSRAAVDALEKTEDERRIKSLRWQIAWFNYRYILCSISFLCLAVAGGSFALEAFGLPSEGARSDLLVLASWGIWFLMAGLGLLCLEFLLGPITVVSNSRSVRS